MSIVAYTGLPGSGKSYSVVEHQILPALRAGRRVVCNIPMQKEAIDKLALPGELVEFSIETLIGEPSRLFDLVTPGSVFVLDEAWKIWPQGMTVNNTPPEYGKLLAEHRHMVDAHNNSTQIVLVVQDLANLAAFARRLVENTFISHKLGFLGLNRSYRVDIYYGGVTGCTPNVNKRLRFIAGTYKKEVYALYKSQTMSEAAGGHGDETKVDGRANMLKRPLFIAGAIFAPLAIGWGLYRFNGAFKDMADPAKGLVHHRKESAEGDAKQSVASPPSTLARVRAVLDDSPRLIMFLNGKQLGGIIAADGRTYLVGGADCALDAMLQAQRARCRFHGVWYDAAGATGEGSVSR
jgi:zona occludens toxin (predicted ATPase)